LHAAAAGTAALLEQRAEVPGQPERIDYPTEITQWRAFADQAAHMTQRWQRAEFPNLDYPRLDQHRADARTIRADLVCRTMADLSPSVTKRRSGTRRTQRHDGIGDLP